MIINIGRQLGSGGREIGNAIAKRLDLTYFDKELIQLAAEKSGIDASQFERTDERSSRPFNDGFFGMQMSSWGAMFMPASGLTPESLFQIQSNVIRDAAKKHADCLFVGRCADYVLRDEPNTLSIFISADCADRLARIAKRNQVDEKRAKELMHQTDKQRASYYNFYTERNWGVASNYNLCVNSSVLGIAGTVDFLVAFIEEVQKTRREGLK